MEIAISRYCRLLVNVLLGAGLVVSALLVTAPPGRADCPAGQLLDPTTRMCWSQVPMGGAYGGAGVGPCEPGTGLCMGDISEYAPTYTVPIIPLPMTDRVDHG